MDLTTLKDKHQNIKYIYRTRVEVNNNITVLELLDQANNVLIKSEEMKTKYDKTTPSEWLITSYWIENERHYMVPLSEKDKNHSPSK